MELVTRKNSTSPVWSYFGLEKDNDGRIKVKMLPFVESVINTYALEEGILLTFAPKNASPDYPWFGNYSHQG